MGNTATGESGCASNVNERRSSSNSASKLANWKRSLTGGQGYTYPYVHASLKRKQIDAAPDVSTTPLPYLLKTLQVANVQMIADSANMESERAVLPPLYPLRQIVDTYLLRSKRSFS